jgi:hypothetical protein
MPVVQGILGRLSSEVLQPVALVIFAAGFLLFLWGLVKFLFNLEEGGDNTEGKQHMLWGIIGMFIMSSIWSIIALLDGTFGLGAYPNSGAAVDPSRNQIQVVQFK